MIKEFKGEYKWLSNFADCKIILNNVKYPSVEHAYMSAKSKDELWKWACSSGAYTAGQIKIMSKDIPLLKNWENIKVDVMSACLRQKFNQEPYKTLLIETGDLLIEEGNWWNDKFWGICLKTNTGQNMLGKLIMEIRETLQQK